jgi:hypothetical protein
MGRQDAMVSEDYAGVLYAIDAFAALKPGWNSYRAPEINEFARQRAKSLVLDYARYAYPYRWLPLPSVAPTPTGGVLLHWNGPHQIEVDITLDPIGGSYSVTRADEDEPIDHGLLGQVDPIKEIFDRYIRRG